MYLIVIAWFYVTAMMAIVEASSPQGSILGACITFALYGLLPMSLLIYILATPERKRKLKARQLAQHRTHHCATGNQQANNAPTAASGAPNTSSHPPGSAQND